MSALDRLSEGDSGAFWELWLVHQPSIFRICLARLGGRHADAEDVCSQVMQKAREVLPRDAGRIENLQAWLTRLAINVCIDWQRVDKRRSQGAWAPEPIESNDALGAGVAAGSSVPDQSLLRRELRGTVADAIDAMPARLSTTARLFFLEQRTYSEIAQTLGITNPNVRKRIQEARALLQDVMERYMTE
jgi:RNA polymerase sigma-70 factor (ECF subfamily)